MRISSWLIKLETCLLLHKLVSNTRSLTRGWSVARSDVSFDVVMLKRQSARL